MDTFSKPTRSGSRLGESTEGRGDRRGAEPPAAQPLLGQAQAEFTRSEVIVQGLTVADLAPERQQELYLVPEPEQGLELER
jgi:hypothetical protein